MFVYSGPHERHNRTVRLCRGRPTRSSQRSRWPSRSSCRTPPALRPGQPRPARLQRRQAKRQLKLLLCRLGGVRQPLDVPPGDAHRHDGRCPTGCSQSAESVVFHHNDQGVRTASRRLIIRRRHRREQLCHPPQKDGRGFRSTPSGLVSSTRRLRAPAACHPSKSPVPVAHGAARCQPLC